MPAELSELFPVCYLFGLCQRNYQRCLQCVTYLVLSGVNQCKVMKGNICIKYEDGATYYSTSNTVPRCTLPHPKHMASINCVHENVQGTDQRDANVSRFDETAPPSHQSRCKRVMSAESSLNLP